MLSAYNSTADLEVNDEAFLTTEAPFQTITTGIQSKGSSKPSIVPVVAGAVGGGAVFTVIITIIIILKKRRTHVTPALADASKPNFDVKDRKPASPES